MDSCEVSFSSCSAVKTDQCPGGRERGIGRQREETNTVLSSHNTRLKNKLVLRLLLCFHRCRGQNRTSHPVITWLAGEMWVDAARRWRRRSVSVKLSHHLTSTKTPQLGHKRGCRLSFNNKKGGGNGLQHHSGPWCRKKSFVFIDFFSDRIIKKKKKKNPQFRLRYLSLL